MKSKLFKIFNEMKQIEPKTGLGDLILQKIDLEKSRRIKKELAFSYFGIAASFSAGVYAFVYFGNAFFKSEFWSIFSLAFSDFLAVAGNWEEYLYSLGETLPVINIVAILVPVFGFLLFLNILIYFKNKSKNIHGHLKFKLN
jgi:hypothetical protein